MLYALVYVGDIFLIGYSPVLIHDLIDKLHHKFALKKLGKPEYFIDNEVTHHAQGSMVLCQYKYIKDRLLRSHIPNAYEALTPMFNTLKLNKFGLDMFSYPCHYRSIVWAR